LSAPFGWQPLDHEGLDYLISAWRAQFGLEVSSLESDLHRLEPIFARPTTTQRIRAFAQNIDAVPGLRPWLPESAYIELDDRTGVVTPEGRVLIELSTYPPSSIENLNWRLADFYATPRRQWVKKELSTAQARVQTLGFAFFLLANGNVGVEQALVIPRNVIEEQEVALRVMAVVNAFSVPLGVAPADGREQTQLTGNWIITEASRKLPRFIASVKIAGQMHLYVVGDPLGLAEEIGRQLSKRRCTFHEVEVGMRSAVLAYHAARGLLMARDSAFGSPSSSSSIASAVTKAFLSERAER
jgi:hypothetical protein